VGAPVAYNTKKSKPLLLNDRDLHQSILASKSSDTATASLQSEEERYIHSKFDWTSKVATAFCRELKTDYALAEGGASGPTFNPKGMDKGFAVVSVAVAEAEGAADSGYEATVQQQHQKLIRSPDNDREANMRRFADAAAELLTEVVEAKAAEEEQTRQQQEEYNDSNNNNNNNNNNNTLDRATALRTDESALEAMKVGAKYVLIKGNEMLFRSPTELALLSLENEDGGAYAYRGINPTTFLGRLSDANQTPVFSIDVLSPHDDDYYKIKDKNPDFFFANVRTNAPLLESTFQNELALHAMAYANWQRSSKHCNTCGSPLKLTHGGTAQLCSNCASNNTFALSWPRQDPSIIVSVSSRCGSRLLLARSHRHPPKMHTVLAGFVEAGESFENAVAREVLEETGVVVDKESIEYVASQPWPFPRSCMVAFSATADPDHTNVTYDEDGLLQSIDRTELVEARWFDREEVERASEVVQGAAIMDPKVAEKVLEEDPGLPLLIPPKKVVARKLIDHWLSSSSSV